MMPIMLSLMFLATCSGQSPLITNSIYGVSSFSGLYDYINNVCGGLVGWAVAIMFFFVIFFLADAYSTDVGVAAATGGGVMAILTLLTQLMGFTGSGMPLLFGGVFVLGIVLMVLEGVLDPFR